MARKILLAAVGLALLIAVAGGGFFALMAHHFHPRAPATDFPPPADDLEAQRQDLRYFRELLALDRSFSPQAREEAIRRLTSLDALRNVLDEPHFRAALMSVDALADNGHSRVEGDSHLAEPDLPIRVAAFSDGLYIMRAAASQVELLGGRVTAIDGQSIDAVMMKLERLRGGVPEWRRLMAVEYLVRQDLLFGTDVARDPRRSEWTVETPTGAIVTQGLDAFTPSDIGQLPATRWLSSERSAGGAEAWRSVEPSAALPPSLVDFNNSFRSLALPGTCAHFVQLKSNADQGGVSIKAFLAGTEQELRRRRPCNVILDLRFDSGGDYLNTYRFARHLPDLIPKWGRVIVLTGPATFSAGITTVVALKHADPERVVIVGQAVGDRLQFFSEGGRACLPHHPLCVAYETGKHDYQHACTDWDECFWLNYFFELRVDTLEPDQIVPWRFSEWQDGIDPALARAIKLSTVRGPGEPTGTGRDTP